MENFKQLAAVPRPSHHEEKISNFLKDWAEGLGFAVIQDEALNIVFDIPATSGYENLPLVILQGHMDMVCVAEEGKTFDPLTDPITVVNDGKTLTADGTSLGADDGSGVAVIMAIAKGAMDHGPLRVLITTDEEDGMEGAFALDSTHLQDAKYLINIDNEDSRSILVSTAAGDSIHVTKVVATQEPALDAAVTIKLGGLAGGHSGVEIGKGRLSGIIGMARLLAYLRDEGITYELASFSGGTANNAIPSGASAVVLVAANDHAALDSAVEAFREKLASEFANIEKNIVLTVSETERPSLVVSPSARDAALEFCTQVINGVYSMSKDMEGLVESSSNLGSFFLDASGLSASTYIRSSVAELETEILDAQLALAKKCGFDTTTTKMADPWKFNPNSKLLALYQKTYKDMTGEDAVVEALHAGLECGTWATLNPELDMVSVGPDISDAHSPDETLYLGSLATLWRVLERVLVSVE